MQRVIRVIATWDAEAKVWVAHSRDVLGLAIEAGTAEELQRRLCEVVPELIGLNGFTGDEADGSVPVELLFRGQQRFNLGC